MTRTEYETKVKKLFKNMSKLPDDKVDAFAKTKDMQDMIDTDYKLFDKGGFGVTPEATANCMFMLY